MISLDQLRPPSAFDPTRAAYKDWLHLNLFDHATGSVGLINVSLHGPPEDPRARAVGTALLHVPGVGWLGNAEVRGLSEARIGSNSIALQHVALAVHYASGTVLASAVFPDDGLHMRVTAVADTPAVDVEQPLPLGPGWLSWYVVPRLTVSGRALLAGREVDLGAAHAYHDHNWGRWHWGEDLGWEWGTFVSGGTPSFACVLARTTDRAHRRYGGCIAIVYWGSVRRTFRGPAVEVDFEHRVQRLGRRIPGAMAALHQDQAALRLPHTMRLRADDGVDCLVLEFEAADAAQVVAADPVVRGYGFINQLAGTFSCRARLGNVDVSVSGLGMLEHVA